MRGSLVILGGLLLGGACDEAGTVVVVRADLGGDAAQPAQIELYVVEPVPSDGRPDALATYVRLGPPTPSDLVETTVGALAAGVEVLLTGDREVKVAALAWPGANPVGPGAGTEVAFAPPVPIRVATDVARRYQLDLGARTLAFGGEACAPDERTLAYRGGDPLRGSCVVWAAAPQEPAFIGWPGDRDCDGVPLDPACAEAFDQAQCDPRWPDDFTAADHDGDDHVAGFVPEDASADGLWRLTCAGCSRVVNQLDVFVPCDCDPRDPARHADALERCDDVDSDCDGLTSDAEDRIQLSAGIIDACSASWFDCASHGASPRAPQVLGCGGGGGSLRCAFDSRCALEPGIEIQVTCPVLFDATQRCPAVFDLAGLVDPEDPIAPEQPCVATLYGETSDGPLALRVGDDAPGLRVEGKCGDIRLVDQGGPPRDANVLTPVVVVVQTPSRYLALPIALEDLPAERLCPTGLDRACFSFTLPATSAP